MSATENLKLVRNNIASAKSRRLSGENEVHLVAVSKTHVAEKIRPVLEVGQRIFGENRVQEAAGKWPALKSEFSNVELHLIGPLQTNKVSDAIQLFDVIQTLDREKLAKSIAKEADKVGHCPKLFVQVNTGLEEQKAGIGPEDAVEFVRHCINDLSLPIIGLMCIPPIDENPGPHFALLRKLTEEARPTELSMGMSSDYELGIEFGATYVRVGSAIFGERGKM